MVLEELLRLSLHVANYIVDGLSNVYIHLKEQEYNFIYKGVYIIKLGRALNEYYLIYVRDNPNTKTA